MKSRDTTPEWVVRRLLHGVGYRYRLHAKDLPGRPDIVFRSRRKAIFVHGCFWHQHAEPGCPLARRPKSRHEFWSAKFEANIVRDAIVMDRLAQLGWQVLVLWECQLRDIDALPERLKEFLET